MKAASVSEIKKDLIGIDHKELVELCMRMIKYKKETKELLTYLLYESVDEDRFIETVKNEADAQFKEINYSNMYYAKKSFRKILRFLNKHIRYSGIKTTELELLIYYCKKLKQSKLSIKGSQQMVNLYERQLEKIRKILKGLHEDLQYDYEKEVEGLQL